jgi:aminoglycoside phosphotransferase (APT) family kinase protein
MDDLAQMPARVTALLEANGCSNVAVDGYEVMTGGYSRLMAKFNATFTQDGATESGTYVLRGDPPEGQALIDTDRTQEFDVIQAVAPYVNTPNARFLDASGEHIGTGALMIDFTPAESTLPWIEANGISTLPIKLAELAGALHTIPIEALPAALPQPADGDALGDQIAVWHATADDHVEALPIFKYVACWLDAHRPAPVPLGFVHHDFSTANMLVDRQGDLVAIDFELATIGDPREDLGYFKAYSQAAPPDIIDADPDAFLARYREITGYTEDQVNPAVMTYFLVLGVIGVVTQLMGGGGAMARGESGSTNIAYNMDNCLFGQAAWMAATDALTAALDGGS